MKIDGRNDYAFNKSIHKFVEKRILFYNKKNELPIDAAKSTPMTSAYSEKVCYSENGEMSLMLEHMNKTNNLNVTKEKEDKILTEIVHHVKLLNPQTRKAFLNLLKSFDDNATKYNG
jgi:hypothetical protein